MTDDLKPVEDASWAAPHELSPELPIDDQGQEFLIPVHGFVHFTDREVEIIDHPAFQRLFNINQLGQTHLVYRGATHRRGEHALGALAAVELLTTAINRSSQKEQEDAGLWKIGPKLSKLEITFARLAVLLHDIGHIAIGHTIEDELGILSKHDQQERLKFVLQREAWGDRNLGDSNCPIDETLEQRIDRLYQPETERLRLRGDDTKIPRPSEILIAIVAKDPDKAWDVSSTSETLSFRLNVLRDLVGNTVCADLIDYLHRDWRHIGKPRFLDTRLLQYMEIRSRANTSEDESDGEKKSHIVVNLQSSKVGRYRSDAVTAILDLLESRYQLWEVALLHRTKTGAVAMLERALLELLHELDYFGPQDGFLDYRSHLASHLLESVFEIADSEFYTFLSNSEWFHRLAGHEQSHVPETSKDILWRLKYRVLHKQVARVDYGPYAAEVAGRLAPSAAQSVDAALRRLRSLHALEADFELAPGSLVMYCAPYGQGQKLAKVRVLYNNDVQPLNDVDSNGAISGGHLDAQVNRFDRLWRASLYASPRAIASLEETDLTRALQAAFRVGLLGVPSEDIGMRDIARMVCAAEPSIEYATRSEIRELPRIAAAGAEASVQYPSGQPTLRSYFGL